MNSSLGALWEKTAGSLLFEVRTRRSLRSCHVNISGISISEVSLSEHFMSQTAGRLRRKQKQKTNKYHLMNRIFDSDVSFFCPPHQSQSRERWEDLRRWWMFRCFVEESHVQQRDLLSTVGKNDVEIWEMYQNTARNRQVVDKWEFSVARKIHSVDWTVRLKAKLSDLKRKKKFCWPRRWKKVGGGGGTSLTCN